MEDAFHTVITFHPVVKNQGKASGADIGPLGNQSGRGAAA